jgi:hypothetical protein
MNKRGNPKSLVASHPGNLNAAKQGVHSPRLIQARAAEIAGELTQSVEFSPAEQLAVYEAARCIAILEAIDRELDQRGLVDKQEVAAALEDAAALANTRGAIVAAAELGEHALRR